MPFQHSSEQTCGENSEICQSLQPVTEVYFARF